MKAVLRLIYTYFTCTPIMRIFSAIGAVLIVAAYVMVRTLPQSGSMVAMVLAGVASFYLGTAMMPLLLGRLAQSHLSEVLPGARIRLLASGLITLLIVALPLPVLAVYGLTASGPHAAMATAEQLARAHAGMVQTFWLTYSTVTLFAGWLYVALWFITSQRNTAGFLKGLAIIAIVVLAPVRQIRDPDAQIRWDVTVCAVTLLAFSVLFLTWPRLRALAGRLRRAGATGRSGARASRVTGREIDLLLGTANPWLLAFGQLLPVILAARIGYYSAAVWLYYLTVFSTVAGAIAGQAAERSRALWLRGDWSPAQLFVRVERSFWRYNSRGLAVLLVLLIAIGSYEKLPVVLLAIGLPLLVLGTILSTYLGLMITRGLGWLEALLAIGVMLALMAVAVLAARSTSELRTVILLESALALLALVLRYVARSRWAQIDWLQCRRDRALTARSALATRY